MYTKTSHSRPATRLAAVTLAAVGVVGFLDGGSNSAQAATSRSCTSTITNGSHGDVVVPAGETCTINSAEVRGSIRVDRGATLKSEHTLIQGGVTLGSGATFSLAHVGVRGTVTGRAGSSVTAQGGELFQGITGAGMKEITLRATVVRKGINVSGRHARTSGGLVRVTAIQSARIQGSLTLRNAYLYTAGSTVTGSVTARGGSYHYLVNSRINGDVDLRTTQRTGSVLVCGTTVRGSVDAISAAGMRFGSSTGDGCGGNTVRGDVALVARKAQIFDNTIRGDADADLRSVTGGRNRVAGEVSGDFPG